jgi:hypothetical protein
MKRTSSDAGLTRKTPKAKKQLVYPMSPAVKMQVDREVRKELDRKTNKRFYDLHSLAGTATTYNGSVYSLTNGIARGDADNNFEGNTIYPKWLQVRWSVKNPNVAATYAGGIRVVIGQQIRAASAPTAATLFEYTGAINASLSPKNNSYSTSFRILYDNLTKIDNFEDGKDSNCITDTVFIPGTKLKPIEFVAATTVPNVGDLFIAFLGDYAPAASDNVHAFYSRFKFSN